MTTEEQPEWEKEFHYKFSYLDDFIEDGSNSWDDNYFSPIKDFIRTTLDKQREEIKEKLKHIPMYQHNLDKTGTTELMTSCYPVQEVLNILDNHLNK